MRQESLLAHWSFDDGSGHDCSSKGHHGIVYGGALPVAGVSGQGIAFDGTDDFVEVPQAGALTAPSTPSELTITAWLRVQSAGNTGYTILSRGIGDAINYDFRLWSGGDGSKWDDNLQFFWRDATGQEWCGEHMPLNTFLPAPEWRFVAVVARWGPGGGVTFFIQGAPQPSIKHNDLCAYGPPLQDVSGTSYLLTIGRRIGELEFFKGELDEVRIWNTALTGDEFLQQMKLDAP